MLSGVAFRTLRRQAVHIRLFVRTLTIGGTLGSRELNLTHGDLAINTQGSVTLQEEQMTLLATVCSVPIQPHKPRFLQADYREKQTSFGKFITRKERESDREMGISAALERSLSSVMPTFLPREIHVMVNTLSSDGNVDSLANVFNAASAALAVSPFAWLGPMAAVRVAKTKDGLILNPTSEQRGEAIADLLYVGTKDKVIAVEFSGKEVSPLVLLETIQLAKKSISPIIAWQEELATKVGATKNSAAGNKVSFELLSSIRSLAEDAFREILLDPNLSITNRESALVHLQAIIRTRLKDSYPSDYEVIEGILHFKNQLIRSLLKQRSRSDGRLLMEGRKESLKIKYLPPVANGTALFRRGDIQISSAVTVGARGGDLPLNIKLIHSYDAFPFSRNTTGRHIVAKSGIENALIVEDALKTIVPDSSKFPFITRLATEVLVSDGENLSAAIVAGSGALASAGIPISGLMGSSCIGILAEESGHLLVSDPAGNELNVLDGDVMVSGTRKGLTHIRARGKSGGVTHQALFEGVDQAVKSYQTSLDILEAEINSSRKNTTSAIHEKIAIPTDTRGKILGTSGVVLRAIELASGTTVSLNEPGFATVLGTNQKSVDLAKKLVHNIANGFLTDSEFEVKVSKVGEYGVFAEVVDYPSQTVFIHQTELQDAKSLKPAESPKIDDVIVAKGLGYERMGKPAFSKKRISEGAVGEVERSSPEQEPPKKKKVVTKQK